MPAGLVSVQVAEIVGMRKIPEKGEKLNESEDRAYLFRPKIITSCETKRGRSR